MRDIHLRANAQSQELGDTWLKLAQLYARNGRDAEAKAAWTRAFAIFEKLPADSFVLASPVTEQALSELAQGHLEIAAAGFERALRLYSTQAHDSLAMSRAAHGAGIVALRQQQIDRARSLIDQALKIRRRDVPGSAEHAETLHASGQVAALAGDLANAERLYCEASALLDDASLKVGGDEFGEARFRAQFAEIYRDCLALKARRGAPDQALEVLERSRARGFRHALEQRRLQLADAPQRAALDALAINVEGEAQARAHAVDPALHESLREIGRATAARLRSERHALEQQLRARLPALAAQDLAGLRRRLRADEAYLAFSVGDNETIALLLRARRL